MPAKKKTTTSKTPAAPKAAPKAPAKKTPVKPAAPKKAPVKKTSAKKAALSPEARYQRVQTEAYFIAEQHGFAGDDLKYWLLAEEKVAKELA
jgi:hypothetical protein